MIDIQCYALFMGRLHCALTLKPSPVRTEMTGAGRAVRRTGDWSYQRLAE